MSLKKILVTAVLMTASMLTNAQSVKQELQDQLAQLKPFSADFTQIVTSAEGDNLSTAQGLMQFAASQSISLGNRVTRRTVNCF
ncbi:hypothetical protein PE36_04138 [Moritella sp. PE36]|nr:hypothetical protein PE36_04138 [Moritella sp. PE36]